MSQARPVVLSQARTPSGRLRLFREFEGRYTLSIDGRVVGEADTLFLAELIMVEKIRELQTRPRTTVSADMPRAVA